MTEVSKKITVMKELQQEILAKQKMLDSVMEDLAKNTLGVPNDAKSLDLVDIIERAVAYGQKNA